MTWADNQIRAREFFVYDLNGVPVRQIIDNGCTEDQNNLSGVSQRRIKYITPTASNPVGLPALVEEKYVDLNSGQECLIGKVANTYSPQGRLVRQDHFDGNDVLAYSLEWEYDAMGHVTKERNALGQVFEKGYDANGNLIFEQGPRRDCHKEYVYDFSDRLIRADEIHADGVRLSTTFRYDYLGNKTASVDPYGNETRYIHDELGRLTQTIYPQVLDEMGQPVNLTGFTEYDPLNRPWKQTDARGFSTTFQYTIHDKPFQKNNPDGTTEWFEYNLDGSLKKTIAPNGIATCYTYDYQLRMIKKEICDPQGVLLSCFSWNYDAYNLLSETDPAEHVTQYQYDFAGRLQAVSKGESLTTHEYDALGRQVKTRSYYGFGDGEFTTKVFVYDLLNRVLEERVEDSSGNCLEMEVYAYDEMGNRTVVRHPSQAGDGITTTVYDSRGQIISVTDPMGNQTVTRYRFDYVNELGQRVPYTETIDPNGVAAVQIYDALGRVVSEFKKNPLGEEIQRHACYYDGAGNLCRKVETVYSAGASKRTVINMWSYDAAKRLVATYEAVGTPEQKQSTLGYNNIGQKVLTVKPDGVQIRYAYDNLGRLASYQSSDDSCHYSYEYDLSNNPIQITDYKQGTVAINAYDESGRLVQETSGNGLTLSYSYDRLGRQTRLILPDNSAIAFSYEQIFLKEVSRFNAAGEKQYSHTYDKYDLGGHVLSASLIGSAGNLLYTVDAMGRTIGIANSNWSAAIQAYDKAGNILQKEVKDSLGTSQNVFSYDSLSQMASEDGAISHQYACDSLFNRVSKDRSAYALNNLNQLLGDGQAVYQYDLNGNLTQKTVGSESIRYVYDAMDRLVAVGTTSQQVVYEYDEQNRRLSKTVQTWDSASSEWKSGSPVNYLYQGLNEIGSVDALGNLLELRLLGVGKGAEIGAAVAMEFQGKAYAPIHDFHGNVVCLISAETGKAVEVYRFSAFGEEQLFDGNGQELESALNPWRFSSKRYDEETGLVYFGRRYYDPVVGRWVTPDPIGFEGGPNLYAYVLNAPLTHVDLYGLIQNPELVKREPRRPQARTVGTLGNKGPGFFSRLRDKIHRIGYFYGFFANHPPKVVFSRCFLNSPLNKRDPSVHMVGERPLPKGLWTNTPGILNSDGYSIETASIFSREYADGYQATHITNPSNGLLKDVLRYWLASRFYMMTKTSTLLLNTWRDYLEKNPEGPPILHTCQSEGAVNTRNALMCLTPEQQQRIIVTAVAPAAYINRKTCLKVDHYVSRDFIPYSDLMGRWRNRQTVHVLTPHPDAGLVDHGFRSPTYSDALRENIQNYLKKYIR